MQGLIFLLYWIPLIYAQYYGDSSATEGSTTTHTTVTSTSAAGAVQTVKVGEDGITFDPDTLTVSPGDKVEFHFFPGDHSVAQAAFSKPCHPLSKSSVFSGVVPATNGEASEVFTLTVNDTNPFWYYCGQIGHCQAGMVGVINPPSDGPNTLAAFKSAASNSDRTTVPAAVNGGILGKPSNGSTGTSTTPGTTSTVSPSASPTGEGSSLRAGSNMSLILGLSVFVSISML